MGVGRNSPFRSKKKIPKSNAQMQRARSMVAVIDVPHVTSPDTDRRPEDKNDSHSRARVAVNGILAR